MDMNMDTFSYQENEKNEEAIESSKNEEAIESSKSEELIESSKCEMSNLGEYELIKILSYFTVIDRISLSRVCRKWQSVIDKSFKSESVLNPWTVLGKRAEISELALCLIIRKCCNVRHIVLSGMHLFQSEMHSGDEDSDHNVLLTIANNCRQLQSIDFGVRLEIDEHFILAANYFKQLKKIVSQNITEAALNSIIDSPNIECINISKNDKISRPDFKRLGPKVKQLDLIESEVTDYIVVKDLCEGNGRNITKLSIDIKDAKVLSTICSSMKQLSHLRLSLYCANCDFSQFSNLKTLISLKIDVTDTSKFESDQFRQLVTSLKKTNLLEMEVMLSPVNNIAIVNSSLGELRENCGALEKLVIRRANSLTNAGMYAIAQIKTLTHLDLMNCLNIGDAIDIVITSCPLLRSLNLHNCSHITIGVVEAFIEKAKANPNEKFTLDVVDTMVGQKLERELPPNMELLYKFEDCIYDCDHGWGEYGYNSGPDDDYLAYDIDDFYGDDDDLDYYDDYEDYDDEEYNGIFIS